MKKIIVLIAFLLAVSIFPQTTEASAKQAGSSAALLNPIPQIKTVTTDNRVLALQAIFKKYNSPLEPYAQDFVSEADKYGVDWKLLPAITGLESTYGNAYLEGTYNVYGWGGGLIGFKNWDDGIDTVMKALKTQYMAKGAQTVYQIGPIYSESPTWAVRVNNFMNEIEAEYVEQSNQTLALTL